MFEPTPKGRQVFRDRAILTNLGPASRAMKVTASADQQSEFTSKDSQTAHLLCRLVAIDHFDSMTTGLNIVGNQAATLAAGEIVMPGMGQADPGPRGPQCADGFFQGRPVLLDVPQLAGPQPFAKRLGTILHETGTHQVVGEVRPRRCIAAVPQFLLDRPGAFQRSRHALEGQLAADLLRTQPATFMEFFDGLHQCRSASIEAITQHMDGGAAPGTGQLDAIDQLHAQLLRRLTGLVQPFEGVVVGQGQDSHASLVRTRNQNRGRQGAVGGRAMAVQINIHRTIKPQVSWRFRYQGCLLLCRDILLLAATVKQFIDFIPLFLFFIVYKIDPRVVDLAGHEVTLGGIYSATAVLIISSLVVYGALFISQRKLEKSQWLTLIACLVFGSLTLAFHSETFLKWKAPVVNWLFALAFIGSHFVGDRLLIKRIMGHALTLPDPVWTRLNIAWIAFFLFCGAANLFVAFTFQSIWVDFKVFGSLGMTVLFLVGQGIYLSRHLHDADPTTPKTED